MSPRTQVALVFPPLVETNFGSIFPSTAVLTAHLAQQNLSAAQFDLNERFADHLLSEPVLTAVADEAGGRGRLARWSLTHRDYLIEPRHGIHRFGPSSPLGYIVRELAGEFAMSTSSVVLADQPSQILARYREFYLAGPVEELVRGGYELIGISVPMGPQLVPALLLAQLLAAAGCGARIVFGGPAISLMETGDLEALLRANPAVDALVQYDGEFPLTALVRMAVAGDWDPGSVPGVTALAGDRVHSTAPAPGPNVRTLPVPHYDLDQLSLLESPRLGVTQARGCYWGKCDYCDFVELYDGSPPFRGRHAAEVVAEMVSLYDTTGVAAFTLITESIPPAFASRFADLLIQQGSPFRWDSFAMVDRRFTGDLMRRVVDAGCDTLVIGMETVITRVLALVSKSADRDENIRFLNDARDAGLPLTVNLIPDLPSTTYAEAMEALAILADLADCFNAVSVYPFEATRSSRVGRQPEKYGFVRTDGRSGAPGQAQFELNRLSWVDPAMTPDERSTVHDSYRTFADTVNARQAGLLSAQRGTCDLAGPLRLPTEDMSVEHVDGSVRLFDPVTRRMLRFDSAQADRLPDVLAGHPFSVSSLSGRVGTNAGRKLVEQLHSLGLLTPAASRS